MDQPDMVYGYVANFEPPEIFPIERKITAKAYLYKDTYYFKVREISDVLGIRQPFDFTADLKKFCGPESAVSGSITEAFREKGDTDRTVFCKAQSFYRFFEHNIDRYIPDENQRNIFMKSLELYL